MPIQADDLERIASKFAVGVQGMHLYEPDYTNWLLIDLAGTFGRQRLLNWLGLSSSAIREKLRSLSPRPAEARHFDGGGFLAGAVNELNPDVMLFSQPISKVPHFGEFFTTHVADAPPVDALVEIKAATGSTWKQPGRYVKDVAKLEVCGAYLQSVIAGQQYRPYLGQWIFDPLGHAARAEKQGQRSFREWYGDAKLDTGTVRVVLFSPDGEPRVLRDGTSAAHVSGRAL